MSFDPNNKVKINNGLQLGNIETLPDPPNNHKLSDIEARLRVIERQINTILIRLNHLASRPL